MDGHFYVEHNSGKHKRVAMPKDFASASTGRSFRAFLPRTVSGILHSAWALKRDRLAIKNRNVWHVGNDNLQAWALTRVVYGAWVTGVEGSVLLFLTLQGLHFDAAPQLPAGYAALVTAAYCPPLWFPQTDRRVVQHYAGDLGKFSIHPSGCHKILRRWQSASALPQDS